MIQYWFVRFFVGFPIFKTTPSTSTQSFDWKWPVCGCLFGLLWIITNTIPRIRTLGIARRKAVRVKSKTYLRFVLMNEFLNSQYNWMAIPPPPEDSNNLSTPLERLLAMEQQKRMKEQAAGLPSRPRLLDRTSELHSGEIINNADSTTQITQCSLRTSSTSSAVAMPGKPSGRTHL